MPRPNCPRKVRMRGIPPWFVPLQGACTPAGLPIRDQILHDPSAQIELTLDELEAVRLADYEGLYQEAAARSMGISRQTFGRIIQQAHRKIAEAILMGKMIKIAGGTVLPVEEEKNMITLAVPATQFGAVDQNFGHCEQLVILQVDLSEKRVISKQSIQAPPDCCCRTDIASILTSRGVSILLTGGIGPGVARLLERHGIRVVRGAVGSVDQAVLDFLEGRLNISGESSIIQEGV